MRNKKISFIFFSFLFLILASCSPGIQNDKNLIRGQLKNGMSYSIYPNAYPKDLVSLRLVVKAGSLMEEEHEHGIAHFTEHMLFNGTPSFPESSLVAFLESQGMRFGGDINAYTSFDQTVYQLEIQKPSLDDSESLKTALKIMREWLRFANFDEKAIEKERGIVKQEKLIHEGFSQRFTDRIFRVLYPNTLLADRLPIGIDETLNTVMRPDFLSFYDKWYRPERASLEIVGDNLDLKELERLIGDNFSDLENSDKETKKIVDAKVKSLEENLKALESPYPVGSFDAFADKEVQSATLLIAQREQGDQKAYLSSLSRETQVKEAVNWLFNRRIREILSNANPLPYQGASKGEDLMKGYLYPVTTLANIYQVALFEGKEKEGLTDFFREWARLWTYAFTEGEFELYKRTILQEAKTAYENKDKRNSAGLIGSLVAMSLGESTLFPSPEMSLQATEKFVSSIQLKEINNALRNDMEGDNWLYFYSYSPEANQELTSEEVMALKQQALLEDLEPYAFEGVSELTGLSFPEVPAPEMSLVSEASGFYTWTLENGIQVFFKPHKLPPRKVLMHATALGLVGLQSAEQWRSVLISDGLVNSSGWGNLSRSGTEQFLSDKNLNLSTSYDSSARSIMGNFDLDSAGDFFESLYALLRLPKIEDLAREELRQQVEEALSAQERDYKTPFSREVRKSLYGANPFNVELQNINLETLESPELLSFYQAQFSDLRDFPFIFVGDIDPQELRALTARYLGTIELDSSLEADVKDLLPYQEGVVKANVSGDPEDRVTVSLSFTRNDAQDLSESREESDVLLQALELAYERLLTEQVREAISGVYGIGFRSVSDEQEGDTFKDRIALSFMTSPEKFAEVNQAVEKVLRQGQTEGFSGEVLDYVRKNLSKTYKDSYQESGYWLSYGLLEALYGGDWEHAEIESYLTSITSDRLQKIANDLISWENKKEVILLPKEKS